MNADGMRWITLVVAASAVFALLTVLVLATVATLETLGTIILTALVGGAGWAAANFIGKPIVTLWDLRGKVHEELIVTGNIFVPNKEDSPEG